MRVSGCSSRVWTRPPSVVAIATLVFVLASTLGVQAQAEDRPPRADNRELPRALPIVTPSPPSPPSSPVPAALDLDRQAPRAGDDSLFRRWWFWSVVGTVVAATVAIAVFSSRGHAPPASDLGNQEFHP